MYPSFRNAANQPASVEDIFIPADGGAVLAGHVNAVSQGYKPSEMEMSLNGAPGQDPGKTIVFIDYQNFYHFLKQNFALNIAGLHLPNLVKAWCLSKGVAADEIRVYTGVHDAHADPIKAASMQKRLNWMRDQGVKVFATKLHYAKDPASGQLVGREKGIDVRMACEIVKAVATENLAHAVVITQDTDLVEAVKVAKAVAIAMGKQFTAYSPILKPTSGNDMLGNGKGCRGIDFTVHLEMAASDVRPFVRAERAPVGLPYLSGMPMAPACASGPTPAIEAPRPRIASN